MTREPRKPLFDAQGRTSAEKKWKVVDHKNASLSASKRQEGNNSSFLKCMSFVPAPQQANAAGNNNAPNTVNSSTAAAAAETETTDKDLLFKLRTFDVYWVDKEALMYKDGIDKVRRKELNLAVAWKKNQFLEGLQTEIMMLSSSLQFSRFNLNPRTISLPGLAAASVILYCLCSCLLTIYCFDVDL